MAKSARLLLVVLGWSFLFSSVLCFDIPFGDSDAISDLIGSNEDKSDESEEASLKKKSTPQLKHLSTKLIGAITQKDTSSTLSSESSSLATNGAKEATESTISTSNEPSQTKDFKTLSTSSISSFVDEIGSTLSPKDFSESRKNEFNNQTSKDFQINDIQLSKPRPKQSRSTTDKNKTKIVTATLQPTVLTDLNTTESSDETTKDDFSSTETITMDSQEDLSYDNGSIVEKTNTDSIYYSSTTFENGTASIETSFKNISSDKTGTNLTILASSMARNESESSSEYTNSSQEEITTEIIPPQTNLTSNITSEELFATTIIPVQENATSDIVTQEPFTTEKEEMTTMPGINVTDDSTSQGNISSAMGNLTQQNNHMSALIGVSIFLCAAAICGIALGIYYHIDGKKYGDREKLINWDEGNTASRNEYQELDELP